ncbi:MAG TPA: efflux RND transporter periplasmic adaptor subunit [Pelomicrobium sp.]|nr:efflux RND transporter periplasmic adaptor subunit [Pelomicrobium sp.]
MPIRLPRSASRFAAYVLLLLLPVHVAAQAPVTVVAAEPAPVLDHIELTGTVTSERSAALSPRVSGLVSAVKVDAGAAVKEGDVLLELDAALARLALARADAALAEARAQQAEAARLREEARQQVERRLVPETRLHAAEAGLRIATAAVERLQAERRQQAEIVARHMLVAPFAGVVSRKLTELGEWVETGTPVLELVDTARLRLDVQAPQERYYQIAAGAPVEVRTGAFPGRVFAGTVAAKVPVKDPSARTFLVRVRVEDAGGRLTPGMSAEARFSLRGEGRALVLPRDAIVRHPDGSTSVWVVNGNSPASVSARTVQLGRTLAAGVEIVSGIEAGARVVLRGNETLREGQSVRIVSAQDAPAR